MNKSLIAISLNCWLTACGSSGMLNSQLAAAPVPANQARISITRSADLLYLAVPADVRLDGKKIGSLSRGAGVLQNIDTGRHHLEVSAWSAPGNFNLTFEAKAGQTYTFEVSPRSEGYWSSIGWGIIGDAIHAKVNENTGPFQAVPQEVKQ